MARFQLCIFSTRFLMKLSTELSPAAETSAGTGPGAAQAFDLPFGLIGLPQLRRFEAAPVANGWPLVQLRSLAEEALHFLAIEPHHVIPGYEIELRDEDAEALQLTGAEDALIFNVVTVHSTRPQYATVNLIGPIIVNRRTLVGQQLIIENSAAYSTSHPLVDERTEVQSQAA